MRDLLLTSFKAQCRYVEQRIHNKKKRMEFNSAMHDVICKHYDWQEALKIGKANPLDEGSAMAYSIYQETLKNLTARFETGIPLETWSI